MVIGKPPAGVEGGIKDPMPDSAGLGRRHIAGEPPVGQASDSVVLTCTRAADPDVKGTFAWYRANPQFVVSVEPPVVSEGFAGPKPSNKREGPFKHVSAFVTGDAVGLLFEGMPLTEPAGSDHSVRRQSLDARKLFRYKVQAGARAK
jgi:hypothetical protein